MRAVLALAMLLCCTFATREATSEVDAESITVPRRSKRLADNHYVSSKTFRKTVVFFRKQLSRRGYRHREIPVYRYRGVLVSRFISEGSGGWNAVHVYRVSGKTYVYVVPRERKKGVDPGGPSE